MRLVPKSTFASRSATLLLASLLVTAPLGPAHAQRAADAAPQVGRCVPVESAVAKLRAENPRAHVFARLDGERAVALLDRIKAGVVHGMAQADQVLATKQVTIIDKEDGRSMVLIGASEGCVDWSASFPTAAYILMQADADSVTPPRISAPQTATFSEVSSLEPSPAEAKAGIGR